MTLTPIRREEAKRLITHLFAHEPFDAELFVERLADVMLATPEIVSVVAHYLQIWNTSPTADKPPYFTMNTTTYQKITEVVLDEAAVYRGETTEEARPSYPKDFYQETIHSLNLAYSFLLAVADGKTDRRLAETHASHLLKIIHILRADPGNMPEPNRDT
jgi:hypothetical protein